MKRVKDEEKATMGPMFPRLHVNDAEKGWPRAPPRNKMALYEQPSIPSQRFSHSVLPFTPYSSVSNSVSHRSQSNGNERSVFSSHQQLPKLILDKQHSQYSDVSSSLTQMDGRKKLNEEDFIVPVLEQARPFRERVKNADSTDKNESPPVSASDISPSLECSNSAGSGPTDYISKQEREYKREERLSTQSELIKVVSNSSINEKSEERREETSCSLSCELGNVTSNSANSPKTGKRELCTNSQPASGDHCAVHHPSNDCDNGLCSLQQSEQLNRIDSVTKTSVLNAVLELNITPDDVVGVMGQKHFWKARRAITNQQRVFATQIFELHRLIKVQKGMAVSTNARDCMAFSTKTVTLAPPPKDLGSDYSHRPVKELPNPSNQESTLENPSRKIQFHKPSFPVVQTNKPPSSHRPSSQSVSSDLSSQWWGYTQPQGQHQWLIPVMSPSEGLVYKPYPGHIVSVPAYAGYNLPGTSQMITNFSSHPQFQLQPFPSPAAHSYFSSHGVPIMNTMLSSSSVEQSNHPQDIPVQLSAKDIHCSFQNQNMFSRRRQKRIALLDMNLEDMEVQGSTASSTNERRQEGGVLKARNMLQLIPTCTVSYADHSSVPHHPQRNRTPPQVIKAVPHHSKSAAESATRIFKSILEERKQFGYL